MAEILQFPAERRETFGKGAARQLRRAGRIPAVIYGHGTDPVHVSLPSHEVTLGLRGKTNTLLQLAVADDESHLVLVKDVQRDAIKRTIEHLDLLVVRQGEKVEVDVPLRLVGEAVSGTIADLDIDTLLVEADVSAIPERIDVDIEGAEAGTHVYAKDVALPEGVTLLTEPDALVVGVFIPTAADQGDTADELAAEEAEAAAAAADEEAGTEAGPTPAAN